MKLLYIIREGIEGILRARSPFLNSMFSVIIALLLISVGVLAVDNGLQLLGDLQPNYDLEVFMRNDAEISSKREIGMAIQEFPGVFRSEYLSKEDAANLYREVFQDDVLALLDDNPLPSSFRVTFDEEHLSREYIQSFIQAIEDYEGVDEVLFREYLFDRVQGLMQTVYYVSAVVIFLVILSTVFLVSNNLRLMILTRFNYIETVRLLGASDFMVKAPMFLEGGILGFMSATVAVLIIAGVEYLLISQYSFHLPVRILSHPEFIVGVFLFSMSLSSLGVLKAVRRLLKFVS